MSFYTHKEKEYKLEVVVTCGNRYRKGSVKAVSEEMVLSYKERLIDELLYLFSEKERAVVNFDFALYYQGNLIKSERFDKEAV